MRKNKNGKNAPITELDDECIMQLVKGNVKVEWIYIGEGYCGDYDPNDPDDAKLLRFTVSKRNTKMDMWDAVESASYCTCFPLTASKNKQKKALRLIMSKVYRMIILNDPIRRVFEELSYLSDEDFE